MKKVIAITLLFFSWTNAYADTCLKCGLFGGIAGLIIGSVISSSDDDSEKHSKQGDQPRRLPSIAKPLQMESILHCRSMGSKYAELECKEYAYHFYTTLQAQEVRKKFACMGIILESFVTESQLSCVLLHKLWARHKRFSVVL